MKKRWLGILLALCLLVCFAPAALAAETDSPADPTEVYVGGENGNDTNGNGSEEKPYASLAKAVEALKGKTGEIYLLSDVTASRLALVDGENGTPANITIDGQGHIVTRSDDFTPAGDQGRGGYNAAMIEVANGSTLTLKNITLDDDFKTEGTEFELAGDSTEGNANKVHDGIIAAYGDGKGTIILDGGTTLKNFGGLSAVYITGQDGNGATLTMKAGSKICDDRLQSRAGGYAAIFNHGGTVTMETDSSIESIDGRAVYIDNAGHVTVNGNIQKITSNDKMVHSTDIGPSGSSNHFGGIVGYVDGNSMFTLGNTGSITEINSHDNDQVDTVFYLNSNAKLTLESSSLITGIQRIGIVDSNGGVIDIAGTINNCHTKNVFFRLRGGGDVKFTLQESGLITNCSTTDVGIVYRNGGRTFITIAGEISDIKVNNAVLFISPNGYVSGGECTITETGKITRVTGEGIRTQYSTLTVRGEISNCSSYAVRYSPDATSNRANSVVIAEGSIISDNNQGNAQIYVNGGSADTTNYHVSLSSQNEELNPKSIQLSDLTITLAENYDDVKLGNVGSDNESTLDNESIAKGWQNALATFWVESETAQELTLSGLSSVEEKLPIYALVMPTGDDGVILNESSAAVYAVTGNGNGTYTLNLPATNATGWAVALVQPSEDYGTLTLTPNPETLQEGATSYSIQYTATFEPSNSFKNELEKITDGRTYTLTFTLDNRLTGEVGTLTKEVTLSELKAGFNYIVTATTKNGSTLSAGDQLVTSVSLEGSLPVPDSSKSVTLVATATVTVTPKPEDPIEPTDPPYIPPVDPDEPADPDDTGVSDLLNTEDHIQYLFGYPDGTFGPENNMTRAEVAQMFYNLLLDQDVEITKTFDDVPANAWYTKAVNTLASLDIISGVGDNKFEPERSITRAEFTAMAMKFAVGGEEGENIFSDVDEDDWFYDAVVNSIQYGWIHGYGDGTFRPQNPITRAEVTAIVNNMLGRAADEDFVDEHAEELTPFSDIEKHWAYYHIVEATNDHDYTKPSSGENWTKLN